MATKSSIASRSGVFINLSCFLILLHGFIYSYLITDVLGQGGTITTSIALILDQEMMENLKVNDKNGAPLINKQVTATVDKPDVMTLSILSPGEGDKIIDESGVLIAKTDLNGQETFVVRGLSAGTATVTFEVIDGVDTISKQLAVDVVGVKAKIEADKNTGEAPLTVTFDDLSTGTVTARKWDFNDIDLSISNEKSPTHTFKNSGLFNVTLEITALSRIGSVKARDNVAICVFPGKEGLPGAIFGTIFDEVGNFPINRAEVLLLSVDREESQRTGLDGTYRFEDVKPGSVIITVCKRLFYDCVVREIDFQGGSLSLNFKLTRRTFE